MSQVSVLFRREMSGYFGTPLAYVFLTVFLVLAGTFAFFLGNFFARGQADLQAFFSFHPWLYLFLVPAISMRLWAEERKLGTIELLLTLPVSLTSVVFAKFLASWVFLLVALILSFPFWVTVNFLGTPDNGVILMSYLGSFLMGGAFLAVGSALSALTKNQVIAFVLTAAVCFLFTANGSQIILSLFTGWAPANVIDVISHFSFLTHFQAIIRGVMDARDFIFFLSVIVFFLAATVLIIDWNKAR